MHASSSRASWRQLRSALLHALDAAAAAEPPLLDTEQEVTTLSFPLGENEQKLRKTLRFI